MQHRKEPGAAHQALIADLHGLAKRYGDNGMPGIERIAVLAQMIGQEIADLPADMPFSSQELLAAVAANIEQGNRMAVGNGDPMTGLLGFGGRQ